jgi:hypothetical protein
MYLGGFVLLAVVLGVTSPALAQSDYDLEADRLADKLWRIIDITKQYQPQFQAHVTLEAPDGERLALTLQGESARTLIHEESLSWTASRTCTAISQSTTWVPPSSPASPSGGSRAG